MSSGARDSGTQAAGADCPAPKARTFWRRKAIIVAGFCLALIILVGMGAAQRPYGKLSQDVRIEFEDAREGSICVTNPGNRTLAVTIGFQVYSNGMWHPPREELFRLPSFTLVGAETAPPKGTLNGDAGPSVRYNFSEIGRQEMPWRVVVLCQKYYASTLMGQIQYAFARFVTRRDSFSNSDHRGPYDEWLYSEAISETNQVTGEKLPE